MILLVHIIFGVAVASLFKNPILAIIAAFLSHYFLDLFPHIEYDIKSIKDKNWHKSVPDFVKVFFDAICGFILALGLSGNLFLGVFCGFVAILPDGMSLVNSILKIKALKKFDEWHLEKIHFLKHKKISIFWRIFTQLVAVALGVLILKIL